MRESIEDPGLPIFVVIYTNESGKWAVDTEDDGSLARYDDIQTALDRVRHIRERGGDACLLVVVE